MTDVMKSPSSTREFLIFEHVIGIGNVQYLLCPFLQCCVDLSLLSRNMNPFFYLPCLLSPAGLLSHRRDRSALNVVCLLKYSLKSFSFFHLSSQLDLE